MHFGTNNKKFVNILPDAELNRMALTESNIERDSGIMISNNLSWEDHINSAVFKATQSLALIKNTFKNIDYKTFKLIYSSMVSYNLDYGVNVWNTHFKKSINMYCSSSCQ